MPVCSLFLKGKTSCFKEFSICRKHTSGYLSWCFSSLTALQTTPCCYFPFFPYPKCSFPTLDTFKHNGKYILSCTVCRNFPWNALSLEKKSLSLPGSTKSHFPVAQLTGSCLLQRPFSQEENWSYHGKVASRLPQEGQRSPCVPPQAEGILQVWMFNTLVTQLWFNYSAWDSTQIHT